ncbi:MAG: DUF5667 domain-containing protein [bacterium]|nr:DUF5667 domain-containing protein [bacterium]
MKSLKIFGLSLAMIFIFGLTALAQETAPETAAAVNLDENIQASDLGISEPVILPDSSFYFLKNWQRGIQSFFTFSSIAKTELKEKFANEKLLELKKTIEQNKNQEAIKKATENYQKEAEQLKTAANAINQKAKENPQVETFLNKFIGQQALHQKLLQKLETQVPSEALAKIKEAKDAQLERFNNVMQKLEDRPEKITEKLDSALDKQAGSQFKEFKNLEVLKNLGEKLPEQARGAIQKAEENSLKRLQRDLEKMSPEDQEKFKGYIGTISGVKKTQLEILENLKARIKAGTATVETPRLQEKLEAGKADILKKINEEGRRIGCAAWGVASDFCKNGRVVFGPDIKGCPSQPICIVTGDVVVPPNRIITPDTGVTPPNTPPVLNVGPACIEIWNPVCGKNGKTYSNECFAKAAGMEIIRKGTCETPPITGIPKIPPDISIPEIPPTVSITPKPAVCIQVITPAISPEGICKVFPTPCDVPANWRKVDKCPISGTGTDSKDLY